MFKKLLPVLLIFVLLLAGCASQKEVVIDHCTYIVDTETATVSDGSQTYGYRISGNSIEITYPNGAWYVSVRHGNSRGVSYSDDYHAATADGNYKNGGILVQAVEKTYKSSAANGGILAGALLLGGFGLFLLLAPEMACYLRTCLWVKNVEPTDFAILYTRIAGVACIVLAIVAVMFGW